MKTTYHILLHLKTPGGFETYGSFTLSGDRNDALEIFNLLKGDDDVSEKSLMYMHLTEEAGDIPQSLQIRHCTLEDLACNTKIITRELFKQHHLETK